MPVKNSIKKALAPVARAKLSSKCLATMYFTGSGVRPVLAKSDLTELVVHLVVGVSFPQGGLRFTR